MNVDTDSSINVHAATHGVSSPSDEDDFPFLDEVSVNEPDEIQNNFNANLINSDVQVELLHERAAPNANSLFINSHDSVTQSSSSSSSQSIPSYSAESSSSSSSSQSIPSYSAESSSSSSSS